MNANERLLDLQAKKIKNAELEEKRRHLENKVYELRSSLKFLKMRERAEWSDVERLKTINFESILWSIVGMKDEQLSKEQKEAYLAKKECEAAMVELYDIEKKIEECTKEIEELFYNEKEYEFLLEQKRISIANSQSELIKEIMNIEKQLEDISKELWEVREALDVGRRVFDLLSNIEMALDEVGADEGKTTIADMLLIKVSKRDEIHYVGESLMQLNSAIKYFQVELADLNDKIELKIDLTPLKTISEWIYDKNMFEWNIKEKVSEAKEVVSDKRREVHKVLVEIFEKHEVYEKQSIELKEMLENMIVKGEI